MKIGVAQIDCRVGEPDANVAAIRSKIARAAGDGCELMLVPEMADTGYDMDAIRAHASAWSDGPCESLKRAAADAGVALICGLSQRDGDSVYNAAAVIDRNGRLVASYRKVHMFSVPPVCEDRHMSRGDSLVLVELGGFRFGVLICYDIRFPEICRALALRGADALAVVAAWPARRVDHWNLLNAARAVENQVYVIAANRTGSDGDLTFGGHSRVIDPFGETIAGADGTESTLIVGEIDRGRLDAVRSAMRVYDDRREDTYGRWYETPS